MPDVHGEFFSEVIRGIDLAARKAGYHILVSGSHSDVGEMLAVLQAMRGRGDGPALMAPHGAPSLLAPPLAAGPTPGAAPCPPTHPRGDDDRPLPRPPGPLPPLPRP